MQYIVVGIVAVTVGFVLGYWIKTLKYWNEKESVKTDSNVKEQAFCYYPIDGTVLWFS